MAVTVDFGPRIVSFNVIYLFLKPMNSCYCFQTLSMKLKNIYRSLHHPFTFNPVRKTHNNDVNIQAKKTKHLNITLHLSHS